MKSSISISEKEIEKHVHIIRKQKVILERDLAVLLGIPPVDIKRAVKRYSNSFTKEFMFSLNKAELDRMKRVTSIPGSGIMKYAPMAFTFDGIEKLYSALNSEIHPAE